MDNCCMIAKALYANRKGIISAIDRYIAKSDDDLSKQLKSEGFAEPKKTVKNISILEDEIADILEGQTQRLYEAITAADGTAEGLASAVNLLLQGDTVADDMEDVLLRYYEDNAKGLVEDYMKETDPKLGVEVLRERTKSSLEEWAHDTARLIQEGSHRKIVAFLVSAFQVVTKAEEVPQYVSDDIMAIIQEGIDNGKGIPFVARQIKNGGFRDSYKQARVVALTETLRLHNIAHEEAIQQSPACDMKEWRHSGFYKIQPRKNHMAMDGKMVPKGQPFELLGADGNTYYPMYPTDPSLPPAESINCHCVHRGVVNEDVLGMSYDERKKLQEEFIANDDRAWEKELDAANRAKAGIDVPLEQEIPRTANLAPLCVDEKMISSNAYKKLLYYGVDETPKVRRRVRDSILKIMNHRNGTDYEDLYFINATTGKVLASTKGKTEGQCGPTELMKKMLSESEENTIIGIHNHPRNSAPSVPDILAAVERGYKYGIVVCHDGTVYKYKIIGQINRAFAESFLAFFQRREYIGYDAEKIKQMAQDAGFEMEVIFDAKEIR